MLCVYIVWFSLFPTVFEFHHRSTWFCFFSNRMRVAQPLRQYRYNNNIHQKDLMYWKMLNTFCTAVLAQWQHDERRSRPLDAEYGSAVKHSIALSLWFSNLINTADLDQVLSRRLTLLCTFVTISGCQNAFYATNHNPQAGSTLCD